jgi:hypothetical protein
MTGGRYAQYGAIVKGLPVPPGSCQGVYDAHGLEPRPGGLRAPIVNGLGNSRHLWMWDYKALGAELEDAGFVGTRRALCGDSTDPRFADVEEQDRWDACLGVECRNPG